MEACRMRNVSKDQTTLRRQVVFAFCLYQLWQFQFDQGGFALLVGMDLYLNGGLSHSEGGQSLY